MTWWEIEGVDVDTYDMMYVEVSSDGGASYQPLGRGNINPLNDVNGESWKPYSSEGLGMAGSWIQQRFDLTTYAGSTVNFKFRFHTMDELYNGFRGWFIDDVIVKSGAYPAPSIDYIEPVIGVVGSLFTVYGSNFDNAAQVTLGGSTASAIISTSKAIVTVPSLSVGTYDVTITNPDTQSCTETDGFTVTATSPPEITSISPESSYQNVATSVTISGSGFSEGLSVTIAGIDLNNIEVVNSNTITATTPTTLPVGYQNVVVTNPDSQYDLLPGGFQVTQASYKWFQDPSISKLKLDVSVTAYVGNEWTGASYSLGVEVYVLTAANGVSQSAFGEKISNYFGFELNENNVASAFFLMSIKGMVPFIQAMNLAYNITHFWNPFSILGTIGYLFNNSGQFTIFGFAELYVSNPDTLMNLAFSWASSLVQLFKGVDPIKLFDQVLLALQTVTAFFNFGAGVLIPTIYETYSVLTHVSLQMLYDFLDTIGKMINTYEKYIKFASEIALAGATAATIAGAVFHGVSAAIRGIDMALMWLAPDNPISGATSWVVSILDPELTTIYPAVENDDELVLGYNSENGTMLWTNESQGFVIGGLDGENYYWQTYLTNSSLDNEFVLYHAGDANISVPFISTLSNGGNSTSAVQNGTLNGTNNAVYYSVTMTDSVLQFQEIEHEDSDDNTSPTGFDIPPLYLALFIVLIITIAVAVMAVTLSGRRRRQLPNNPPDSNTDPWPGQESGQAQEQWDWPDPHFQYSDHPTDWEEWKGKR